MSTPLSYLEVSRGALQHNLQAFRKVLHLSVLVGAVVKGNAYGHGQREVTEILENEVDYFLVDDLDELRLLRQTSQKPALVLGYIPKNQLAEALELKAELAMYDTERIKILEELAASTNQQVKVHLKIDCFLGRQGVLPEEMAEYAALLKDCPHLTLVAAYAHFANIEDTTDPSHAKLQIKTLQKAVNDLRQHGFSDLKEHISATSGVMVYEQGNGHNYLVRPGIGCYGLYPSSDLAQQYGSLGLRPALRWVSHLAQVKTVPADFPIGYGLTYRTTKPTRVAIVPQGYSDGYDRGLSNQGEVLIHGTRCPVLGRVAMNMFTVDVSHLPDVRAEDEVVLLGEQGDQKITAEELAEKLSTINYEITTRISSLLPRLIVE